MFIYGDGELKEIQIKINAAGLSEKVSLMGYTKQHLERNKKFRLFCFKFTFNEDMPGVLIEALSEQKPIISTDLVELMK